MNEKNLHNYQLAAIEHILGVPYCGLFMDMGLGKTVATLTAIRKLMFEELAVMRVLVIAPKRVAENVWVNEIKIWEHLSGLTTSLVAGSVKKRELALRVNADIHLLGRDNVVWLYKYYEKKKFPFDMLIVDESSSFKNPKSQRFKALRKLQPLFKRVVLLTGTPAPNSLIDLWSQIYLLDRGERLSKFITKYRQDYFTPGQTNGAIIYNYALRSGADKLIQDKISDICMSMKAKDYLELPERVDNFIKLRLPPKLKKQYKEFEKEQILQLLDQGDITALNAASLSNKLLQFANGAVYDDDKTSHEIHTLKLEALEEIIEAANSNPVLVAWTYRQDLERILTYLKRFKPQQLDGAKSIEDWNNGKTQVFLMHPASGGHGLNLQKGGNIIVWFGQTWSLELYQQFNARLHRQGQKKTTVIHHLITEGTIDGDVIKTLKRKKNGQEGLIQAIKAKIKKYELQKHY